MYTELSYWIIILNYPDHKAFFFDNSGCVGGTSGFKLSENIDLGLYKNSGPRIKELRKR